jgi:hypothetical protein
MSDPRVQALVDALEDISQAVSWVAHGSCRGFSDRQILSYNDALENSRAAITQLKRIKRDRDHSPTLPIPILRVKQRVLVQL